MCNGITDLNLTCGFKSAHWSSVLANLRIKKLTVCGGNLETLQCFAAGPIRQSLEELTLEHVSLPPSDITHLYGLQQLRSLRLVWCFSPRLPAATIASLCSPTPLLPALTELFHQSSSDRQFGDVDRVCRMSGCNSDSRSEIQRASPSIHRVCLLTALPCSSILPALRSRAYSCSSLSTLPLPSLKSDGIPIGSRSTLSRTFALAVCMRSPPPASLAVSILRLPNMSHLLTFNIRTDCVRYP